jgi:arylsulfatase A-like enzyme
MLCAICIACVGCREKPPPLPANPVNVVIVSIDTLRPDHLGCYGYDRATSRSIDLLASESVLFENAYSQSPKTAASHMSVMTGLYPEAHGVRNWNDEGNERLSDHVPTLATRLRQAGYRTRAVTGFGNVRPELGFDQGFESYAAADGAQQAFASAGRIVRELTAETEARERPFFLFVHTYEVHDPYAPPLRFARRFSDPEYAGEIPSSRRELQRAAGLEWSRQHEIYWNRVDRESPADVQRLRDLYDGAIRLMDDEIGEFVAELRRLEILDRTLFVFLSDHGEEFAEHGGFLHSTGYEEVLRVPLLIRFPGTDDTDLRGREQAVVRLIDVLPTVLDWIGLPTPAHVQGRSLLSVLRPPGEATPRPVLSQWRLVALNALRVGDLKYIRKGNDEALYDLAVDPGERHSLLEREPERAAAFLAQLYELVQESKQLHAALGRGTPVELDEAGREQLEALGYLAE